MVKSLILLSGGLDSLVSLGLEKEEEGTMEWPPRNSKESIFAGGLWYKIITEGIMLGSLTLFAFSLGNKMYGVQVGRTMAFVSLGLLGFFFSFSDDVIWFFYL